MNEIQKFREECEQRAASYPQNEPLQAAATQFMNETLNVGYSYNFTWMGRPIIQYPQDMIAIQEVIWKVQPDLIIETGIAHGGSLIFHASMLELIGKGEVLGIDIDIRAHNRQAIEQHPMFKRITMLEGSSVSEEIMAQVRAFAKGKEKVLVILDSNHTHEHVLREMELYAPLVTPESYLLVFDSVVEFAPEGLYADRPWSKGDNPYTAIHAYLNAHPGEFEIDRSIQHKLLITVAPDGYLKRVK